MPLRNRFITPTPEVFEPVDAGDILWLDPNVVSEVNELITSAHIPTMALGAMSRNDEFVQQRSQLKEALGLQANQVQEVDYGFMYGIILAEYMQGEPQNAAVRNFDDTFYEALGDVTEGLSFDSLFDAHELYARIRDVEVAVTGSDTLAFCLASSQQHIGKELEKHLSHGDVIPPSEEVVLRQAQFYAGALFGVLAAVDTSDLPRTRTEILRSLEREEYPLGDTFVLDPDDSTDLAQQVNELLNNRYAFTASQNSKGSYMVHAVSSGVQYGPSAVYRSHNNEPETSLSAKRLDYIVVQEPALDSQGTQLRLITNVDSALRNAEELGISLDIIAIGRDRFCVSKYGESQHSALNLSHFIANNSATSARKITYCEPRQLNDYCETRAAHKKTEFIVVCNTVFTLRPEFQSLIADAGIPIDANVGLQVGAAVTTWLAVGGSILASDRRDARRDAKKAKEQRMRTNKAAEKISKIIRSNQDNI